MVLVFWLLQVGALVFSNLLHHDQTQEALVFIFVECFC